ncbi:2-amino-4-hydroxy-6-hydroxymethyldihydropteridine diphosphokinase [Methylophaga sp. OBS3]|uniref:2-amino-4-hydroxy-6- hydroxymethyldihydropteridine diphosphokinase n=1 Tax=Methylophaga sp. OBS3 TaxID=2991934 RepID=UPI00224EA3C2|nr:2-amino-4-hydroxy-6-hydroxymethyldihydropteridine diphosphokinase [Methylophaga sp. OBS3]MCX4189718.1 2-amino-4-hydroxy-6-hydroxymethyldihydropteridine diphosphokinase [Methylophaga sp. OBS3]
MTQQAFLIGLGSNIAPAENMALMVKAILPHISGITISRVLQTPPVGMNSHRYFLNAVAYIETSLCAESFKTITNQIEAEMGRDRSDPDKKHKDRPADIDILCAGSVEELTKKPASAITDEYFLYPLIDELFAHLAGKRCPNIPQGVKIDAESLLFGEAPATINGNTNAGHERVL